MYACTRPGDDALLAPCEAPSYPRARMSPRVERRELPVLVHGATGYTGKLVARELVRRGVPFALSGRSARKLADLATVLGIPVPQIVIPEGETAALTDTLRNVRAVINCAGPFGLLGEAVVKAAVAAGSHYLDVTGEQEFVRRCLEHDRAATLAPACIVPSMAFEVSLSDMAARLVGERLGQVDELAVTYRMDRVASSGGTQRSALRMLGLAGGPAGRHSVTFPGDRSAVSGIEIPGADVVTIPRHTPVRDLHVYMSMGGTLTQLAIDQVLPRAAWLLNTAPGRWFLRRVESRPTGEGPTDAERATHRWRMAVEGRGAKGKCTAFLAGPDPYGLTAVIAVKAAQLMLDPGFDKKGVLSPAMTFDAGTFLEALKPDGLSLQFI